MSIIQDGQSVLNDLFTNNVDFVAKQMQVLIDFLFPSNEDNSDTVFTYNPYIVTGQCIGAFGSYASGGMYRDVCGLYNVHYSSNDGMPYITYISDFGDKDNPTLYANIVSEHQDNYSIAIKPDIVGHDIRPNGDYGGRPIWDYTLGTYAKSIWTNSKYNVVDVVGNTGFLYSRFRSVSWNENQLTTPAITLVSVDDTKTFVITDIPSATSIYNDYINYYNDYHTYNTYNFNGGQGNGGGTIYVGGGAGGIAVGLGGALCYNDVKFALDSLIDDLNFNFNNADNKLPITELPSYYDIKYEDMGSFYITPIKQLDALPVAPDLADTVIDISEPVGILHDGFNGVLGAFDSLGITLMVSFTFVARLCIRKLKGE